MGLRDKLEEKVFKKASKYLNRDKAKKLLMESTEHTINGTDYSDEVARKYGEAIIYFFLYFLQLPYPI